MSATSGNVTRRAFVVGSACAAAASTIVLAAGGIANAEEAPSEPEGVSGDQGLIPSATLNPQDYDYRQNSGDLSAVFSEWKLGPLTLSHRIVKSAAGSDTWNNGLGEEMIEYYMNFARGGVEMIWVENFANLLTKYPVPSKTDLDEYDTKQLVDPIHEAGAYIGYQFDSMGATIGTTTDDGTFQQATAADLTPEDIKSLQEDIISGAKKLCDAGFDAFEINAAGNNIGQSFFSRMRNTRDDDYGPQSLENRARFVCEIIQGIKEQCGQDFIVQVLINGIEENDQNLGDSALMTTVEENLEIAKLLEAAGADSLHVRLGPLGMHVCQFASDLYFTGYGIEGTTSYGTQFDFSQHWQGKLDASHSGCGMMLDVAAEIKKAVSIPVGTVTYMDPAHAPDMFQNALAEGKVDFLIMNRPLTVDPDYVNKLREGRIDEIAPCTRCMHCHFDVDLEGSTVEHCRVNACTQRAFREEMPEGFGLPALSGDPKRVMVVGGGPAGMECARVAALRGHEVTLYERNGMLGGLLSFASAVKGPHENLGDLNSYLQRQLELAGVTVVTGTEVTAETVAAEAPDALVLACGGLRDTLGLEASASTQVVPLEQVTFAETGTDVTVVGSNAQAVDAALWLQAHGRRVTMVTPDPLAVVDKGQSNWVKTFVMPMLYARGMRVWPNASISAIGDGTVTIAGDTGCDVTVACDAVVEAMDMLPNTALLDEVEVAEAYAIGDCASPFNILEAIKTGNTVGRKL